MGERLPELNRPKKGGSIIKNVTRLSIGVLLAILVIGLCYERVLHHNRFHGKGPQPTIIAQDPVKVSMLNYKVLFENGWVRVLEYYSKTGDKDAMHSHPEHIVYFLSSGKLKAISLDGKTREAEFKSGQVHWFRATTHALENIGTTDMRALVVELKK